MVNLQELPMQDQADGGDSKAPPTIFVDAITDHPESDRRDGGLTADSVDSSSYHHGFSATSTMDSILGEAMGDSGRLPVHFSSVSPVLGVSTMDSVGGDCMVHFEIKGKRKLRDLSKMPGEDSGHERAKRQREFKGDDEIDSLDQGTNLALPLHMLGIDLLGEILGWLSAEDLIRACLASQYLLAITNLPSFRRQLRTVHSSRRRSGPFLGVVLQRGSEICLRSPRLRFPMKSAAVALSQFLQTESRRGTNFTLRDSRDGRMLLSTGQQGMQFLVWSPFEEHSSVWLPMSPVLAADGEELICASYVPDDATRDYTVIAISVKISNRYIALVKKFKSKGHEWSCSMIECAFHFPSRTKLRATEVIANGHTNLWSRDGVISVSIESLMMRVIPLPHESTSIAQRNQMLCRNKEGSLCLVTVRVVPDTAERSKKFMLYVSVFDWAAQHWKLANEWPALDSIPWLNLVGVAEDQGTVIVGSGWHSLYVVDIEDGTFSHEMQDTGAGNDALAYEIEYPSTSWWAK